MNKYEILNSKEEIVSELIVKKSKFIAKVYYVDNLEKIERKIEQVRTEYKDARHVVFAYRLLNTAKFSDDKEPQGTAGKPIYSLLEKENLVNILVVVIRYFGGVLLGAGPLTRAYSKVANDAIKKCVKKEYIEYAKEVIVCEYKDEEKIKKQIEQKSGIIKEIERTDKIKIIYIKPK